MATYVIRCRLVWLSLTVAFLLVALMASMASPVVAIDVDGGVEDSSTMTLPSDGHLNSHVMMDSTTTGSSSSSTGSNDCKCRQHTQPPPQSTTETTTGARIFYLVMVHNVFTLQDAVRLFRALRDPRHSIVFHVDRKVHDAIDSGFPNNATELQNALTALQDEMDSCPCGSRVYMDSVHTVQWSHWSMNLPTLWGMQVAVTNPLFQDKWDVFINLSGDTYPVYTPGTMAQIFGHLQNYNFVTSRSCETGLIPTNVYAFPKHWHKRKHYTNNDNSPPPIIHYNDISSTTTVSSSGKGTPTSVEINYYFGSQWVALQPTFVRYLVTELARNDSFPSRYRDHLLKTGKVMTDETFLPTVLMHTPPFNTTTLPRVHDEDGTIVYDNSNNDNNNLQLPPIRHLRYERMDERIPSPLRGYFPKHPRYEVPQHPPPNMILPPAPHTWGPYYLGTYDLADIADSGALFIRKVSSRIDDNLFHLLPVDSWQQIPRIQWPTAGIQVSAVPNWQDEKRQLMQNAVRQATKEGQEVPTNFKRELGRLQAEHDTAAEQQQPVEEEEEYETGDSDNLDPESSSTTQPRGRVQRELQGTTSSDSNKNGDKEGEDL
ncbi:expressed unknown protein [Seminavis robusta]|uniref:protein xylosyltransferase n=1 Tax=Seminavis robusta TaxID=568900 RepID=A0A9N8DVI2_9STRA|nr:expressed unknown protein [Seminavis robusta]|eukprot:Sro324_g117630.1 n/a (600) ;mRNA; f:59924-61723